MDILFNPDKNRMTNMQLCRLYMDEFVKSAERKWMMDGDAYYRVDNPEIMNRKKYRYRENEATGEIEKIIDNAKPNNKSCLPDSLITATGKIFCHQTLHLDNCL